MLVARQGSVAEAPVDSSVARHFNMRVSRRCRVIVGSVQLRLVSLVQCG